MGCGLRIQCSTCSGVAKIEHGQKAKGGGAPWRIFESNSFGAGRTAFMNCTHEYWRSIDSWVHWGEHPIQWRQWLRWCAWLWEADGEGALHCGELIEVDALEM